MRRLPHAIRALLVTVVIGGVAVGACLAALIPGAETLAASHHYTSDKLGALKELAQRSTVFDSGDPAGVVAVLGLENRQDAALKDVPKIIQQAVIAVEDKTFWTNDGVDINAVVRAALKNLTSGEIEQGGSTITQQLVKNRILTSKRDINRKIREIILALRLNEKYSKNEILEQYLNTVYFGQGSYGVKSAVERFFTTTDPGSFVPRGKQLFEVTTADAALLAGLISNPEGNNPFTHPDRALARRKLALHLMVQQHDITQAEADAANQEALPTVKPEAELRPRNSWAEEVQDRLFHDPVYKVLGATVKERKEKVLTGGLRIYATLDPKMQADAQRAMDNILPEKPGFTGSLVAIDPRNGEVKAMVAGPGFESSQYNIATSYPGRQSGSTWKVITLAAALESGFSPNDLVEGTSPCAFGAQWGQTQNAEGGGGQMTLRAATAHSVNCAFARTELAVGLPRVIRTAQDMGITQTTLKPILTLTLGTIESTALEMATVTATIANSGIHHDPVFVRRIETPDGEVVFDDRELPGKRAISENAATCEMDLLRGVVTGGTGTGARLSSHTNFGKTGTTDNKADANFLGGTPQLVAFVWHGNALARVPGAGFGGQIPARIFKAFMDAALAGQPDVKLPTPGPFCARSAAFITEGGRVATIDGLLPGQSTVPTLAPPTVVIQTSAPTAPPATSPSATLPPTTLPSATTVPPPST
jgi:membrane peptidoglycan carboxypeptidase